MILPPYIPDEEKPDLTKYKKSENKSGSWGVGGCLVVVAWLAVANIVHNQLWGANIPEDGLLLFLIFDSIVAAAVVGAIAVPIAVLWWLFKKLTK